MNDPDMLGALEALGYNEDGSEGGEEEEEKDGNASDANNSALDSDSGIQYEINETKRELEETEVTVATLKRQAITARKEGRKGEAKELYHQYKQELETQHELIQLLHEYQQEQKQTPTNSKTTAATDPTATTVARKTSTETPIEQTNNSTNMSRNELISEIKKYQTLALTSKQNDDLEQTKFYFGKYKSLQQVLLQMPADMDNLSSRQTDASANAVTDAARVEQLHIELNNAKRNALTFKKNGDIISAKEELAKYKLIQVQIKNLQLRGGGSGGGSGGGQDETQLILAKRRQLNQFDDVVTKELVHIQRVLKLAQASKDQELLRKLKNAYDRARQQKSKLLALKGSCSATSPVPSCSIQTIVDSLTVVNTDVPPHVLLLTIHHLENAVYKKERNRSVNLYCKYDFGYPRNEPEKGQTNVMSGNIAMTSWEHRVTIPLGSGRLTSKATIRHFEKRKITFEIYHQKKHLFSSTDVCISKAECTLSTLLNKSSMNKILLPLFAEDRRKPTGGSLVISMKLKEPLIGKDVRKIKRSMLVINDGGCKK